MTNKLNPGVNTNCKKAQQEPAAAQQEEAQQQHKRAKKGRREVEGESEVRPVFIRGPRCKLVVRVSNLTLYTPNSRGGGKLHIVLE